MLTTLSDVKAWLNAKNADDDALLTRWIVAASAFIERYIDRQIEAADYSEIRNGNGRAQMRLINTPCLSVSTVLINGETIPAAASFGAPGYFFDKHTVYLRGYTFARGVQNVQIIYRAGYEVVPPDIAQVCIDLVALRYRERDRIGHQSKSLAGETVSFLVSDLSPWSKTALKDYERVFYP